MELLQVDEIFNRFQKRAANGIPQLLILEAERNKENLHAGNELQKSLFQKDEKGLNYFQTDFLMQLVLEGGEENPQAFDHLGKILGEVLIDGA